MLNGRIIDDTPGSINNGKNCRLFVIQAAIAAPIDQLAFPGPALCNRVPQFLVKSPVMQTATQDARVPPQHVVAGIASESSKEWIDIHDVTIQISHHDGFRGLIDYGSQLRDPGFGLLALRNVAIVQHHRRYAGLMQEISDRAFQPAPCAVAMPEAIFDFERVIGPLQKVLKNRLQFGPIVWMKHLGRRAAR